MRHSVHWPRFVGVLLLLFVAGIALGLGYQWLGGSIIPPQLFVNAAGNAAPLAIEAPAADVPAARNPTTSMVLPSPETTPGITSNQPSVRPSKSAPQANGNVVVLNPVKPPATPLPSGGMILPQSQPGSSTDRLPVIGSEGHTIWVPRAIEGCWAGSGGGRLQYLGGCPNLFTGSSSPIALRWCFRRMGNQPLTLTAAKGQYPGRVSQRWDVIAAKGQTIELREKISYKTMVFLHVVDVGDWSCRITSADELVCDEHELARCGPGKWMQGP
jgi:hypothetical protein